MKKVSKDTVVYAMSAKNKPVLYADPGDRIQFETWDALHGQVQDAEKGLTGLDWDRVNPATGPVYINGAEEGDILSVHIEKIEVEDAGIVLCGAGMGVLGHTFDSVTTKKIAIKDGEAHFSDNIRLPLNKMIGVIGVAPKHDEISCGIPDYHGGNMDCKEIKEGATILLPVYVPGALLALGDLHAIMADGEVSVTGLEVGGMVTVTVDLIKNTDYPLPMIINDSYVMTLASDEDLDVAVEMAVSNMVEYLTTVKGFSKEDAVMLISLIADVRICQVVDAKRTARVEFPKKLLSG
jgi:amidase